MWDNDYGSSGDDAMSMSKTVLLLNQGRFSTGHTHCANTACDRFIKYDYKILTPVCGNLQINIRYAHNLTDTGDTLSVPDLYVHCKNLKVVLTLLWVIPVACLVAWDDNSGSEISDPETVDVHSGYNSNPALCL